MSVKKQTQHDEKVSLKLSAAERKLVLEEVACLDESCEQIIRDTPNNKPVMMTLDELDEFGRHITAAVEQNNQPEKLSKVFDKVQRLLDTYTLDEPSPAPNIEDSGKREVILEQAAQIAEFVTQALMSLTQLRIKTKPLDNFWLAPKQREVLLQVPGLSQTIKNKLTKEKPLSAAEVASMTMAVSEELTEAEGRRQVGLLLVAEHLMDRLEHAIAAKGQPPAKKKPKTTKPQKSDLLYQFKITLLGWTPPIWRRIQVQDCTLDTLHEHIQMAMGWTNSHLHEFVIKRKRYGDLDLLDDGFEDFQCEDSTTTMLSDILPKTGKQFVFKYKYDFGDGWEHEVRYEGSPPVEKAQKYPLCLEGERACPPEDCGGIWGYEHFLEAIRDPKHEEHEHMLWWIGGSFDSEAFDANQASMAMKKGLPNW